jgi:hypothetical protein
MAILKIRTLYTIGNDNTTNVDLFIFGTAEPATAIMAASIPVLRALIQRGPQSGSERLTTLPDHEKVTTIDEEECVAPYPGTRPLGHLDEEENWEPTTRGVRKFQ